MLSTSEIKKLSDYLLLVFKDVFVTKSDLHELLKKVDKVQNSLDGFAKTANRSTQEEAIMSGRVIRLEGWTIKAANKIGLPYNP